MCAKMQQLWGSYIAARARYMCFLTDKTPPQCYLRLNRPFRIDWEVHFKFLLSGFAWNGDQPSALRISPKMGWFENTHILQLWANRSIKCPQSFSCALNYGIPKYFVILEDNFDVGNIGAYVDLGNHRTFVHFLHWVGARVLVVRQNWPGTALFHK